MGGIEIPKIEKKEEPVNVKTLSATEFKDRIYKGENMPQDKRFLPVENGGVFKYLLLSDLIRNYRNGNRFYPIVETKKEIAGIAELEKSPYQEKTLWIKFLSVDPKYQGNGYGTKLAEEIFRFAKEEGFSLEGSIYSDIGRERLKKLLSRLAEKFGVEFVDGEDKYK